MIMFKNFKLLVPLIIITILNACSSREFEYLRNYPELFTVAINSMLDTRGYLYRGWLGNVGPSIRVRYEDSHGRRLFEYTEDNHRLSYIIIQKVDEGYAYFYPHYNFVFSHRDIPSLKESNSWNKEMSDRSEFVRVRIVRTKERGPISDHKLIELFQLLFPKSNSDRRQILSNTVFFRTDNYGRSIYSFGIAVVLFQPDHSFDIETGLLVLEREYWYNYQTKLRLFMEANGWDTPFYE